VRSQRPQRESTRFRGTSSAAAGQGEDDSTKEDSDDERDDDEDDEDEDDEDDDDDDDEFCCNTTSKARGKRRRPAGAAAARGGTAAASCRRRLVETGTPVRGAAGGGGAYSAMKKAPKRGRGTAVAAYDLLEHIKQHIDPRGDDFLELVRCLGSVRVLGSKYFKEHQHWLAETMKATQAEQKHVLRMLANSWLWRVTRDPVTGEAGTPEERDSYVHNTLQMTGESGRQNKWKKKDVPLRILEAMAALNLPQCPLEIPGHDALRLRPDVTIGNAVAGGTAASLRAATTSAATHAAVRRPAITACVTTGLATPPSRRLSTGSLTGVLPTKSPSSSAPPELGSGNNVGSAAPAVLGSERSEFRWHDSGSGPAAAGGCYRRAAATGASSPPSHAGVGWGPPTAAAAPITAPSRQHPSSAGLVGVTPTRAERLAMMGVPVRQRRSSCGSDVTPPSWRPSHRHPTDACAAVGVGSADCDEAVQECAVGIARQVISSDRDWPGQCGDGAAFKLQTTAAPTADPWSVSGSDADDDMLGGLGNLSGDSFALSSVDTGMPCGDMGGLPSGAETSTAISPAADDCHGAAGKSLGAVVSEPECQCH
jgi:hypothetical protein